MTVHIDAISIGAGSSGQYYYNNPNPTPVLVKNVGDITAYIGGVDSTNGSSVVDPNGGFPLLPGETREFPAQTNTNYRLGFNTASGSTSLRVLGLST